MSKTSNNIGEPRFPSVRNILALFVIFFCIALLFRFPWNSHITFLNEDTALINGAIHSGSNGNLLRYFYTSYGPRIIRPFQIIGMYFEQGVLGLDAFGCYFISFLLLALAQTLFVRGLWDKLGNFGGSIAALLITGSFITAEPILWLSDRHDLYLFVALGFQLVILSRIFFANEDRFSVNKFILYLCLYLSFWIGFWCNEKGTVLPIIISLIGTMRWIGVVGEDRDSLRNQALITFFVAGFSVLSYFIFRYAVLGALIGGYDDKILPKNFFSFGIIKNWLSTLAFIPFRQGARTYFWITSVVIGLGYLCCLVKLLHSCIKSHLKIGSLISLIILAGLLVLVSSAPTLRFSLEPVTVGGINTRMLWLPLITICSITGLLYHLAFKHSGSFAKIGFALLATLHVCAVFPGGIAATTGAKQAYKTTHKAIEFYHEYCSCASKQNSISGLPVFAGGFNAYTESSWIHSQAQHYGLNQCTSETTCKLKYFSHNGLLGVNAQKISRIQKPNFIADRLSKAIEYPIEYRLERFSVKESNAKDGDFVLRVKGFAWQKDNLEPIESIAVIKNDMLLAVFAPNTPQYLFNKDIDSSPHGYYGFRFTLRFTSNPAVDEPNIRIVALEQLNNALRIKELEQ
ncbi:MAG: hypothetical protein KDD53_05035 [Bdellovibrionales bacterium]|nr:hypothetical protein [Bdellovibrionales bacterium]